MNDDRSIWKCSVCGDAVLARNYGALTCKSCKPFFRRNVNKQGTFRCKFDGNCKITIRSRKKCRKCRLDKCFAVGMRKELIMDDVDKHFRRSLLEAKKRMKRAFEEPEKRLQRDDSYRVIQYSCSPDSSGSTMDSPIGSIVAESSSSDDSYLVVEYSSSPDNDGTSSSQELASKTQNDDSYRAIEYSSSPVTPIRATIEPIVEILANDQSFDYPVIAEDLEVSIWSALEQTAPLQANQLIPYCQQPEKNVTNEELNEMEDFIRVNEILQNSVSSYRTTLDIINYGLSVPRLINDHINGFTEYENHKLWELSEVLRPLDSHFNINCMVHEMRTVMEMVKMIDKDYERSITMFTQSVKRISVFDDVCENDKIALVKNSCLDIIILRSYHLYDQKREAWILPIDQDNWFVLKVDFIKCLSRNAIMTYKKHVIELTNIIRECDSDAVVIDLLTAIALFNPNCNTIIGKDKIGLQQRLYIYLLQRYLQMKYRSDSESTAKFSKLFNTLIFCRILAEWEKKYFVEDYREGYCPLVKEVFDINYCTDVQLCSR